MRQSPSTFHRKRTRGKVSTRLTLFWILLLASSLVFLVGSSQSASSRAVRDPKSSAVKSARLEGRRLDAKVAAAAYTVTVPTVAPLLPIDVDRTDDDASANVCTPAPNDCSLRGAVSFANSVPGTTINLPAGTYALTISGAGEGFSGNNAIGDLDVRGSGTLIVGAGAASTTIQQTVTARVIEVNPFLVSGFSFSISGVTITGGQENTGVGGGGIISGAINNTTAITDSIITANSATGSGTFGGGGLCNTGGNVNISGTTFSSNSTSGSGGAVSYSAGDFLASGSVGTLTVTTSSFSSNTAQSASAGGGAIDVFNFNLGSTSAQISTSAFVSNNAANGRGGAVIVESGSANIQYSRLVGNTAATGGRTIHRASGTLAADNNWWGLNSGPAANANSGGAILTWLQLRAVATPNHACSGASVNLTADIYGTRDNTGPLSPVPNCPGASCALNGLPAFSGTVGGTSTSFVNGAASGSFVAGSGTASATADGETVTADFTIDQAPTVTTDPTSQAVCEGSLASFTAAANGSTTVKWQVSSGGPFTDIPGATSTTLSFTAAASDSGNQYRAVFSNDCGSATSAAATLTVNTAPVITLHPMSQTVTSGNAIFTAAANGNPTPSVQWQESVNGGASFSDMPGETSTTLTVPADTAHNGRQYRAVFTNSCGSATTNAATLTTCEAPTFNVTTSDISVWPPNHQYGVYNAASFGATASSGCDGNITNSIQIISVSSDEPDDNPLGADGTTINDIVIAADCKSVQLRAERDGNLNGRVYTITLKATDARGVSSTTTVTVSVPKNQTGGAAVNDGPAGGQTVNGNCP